MELTSIIYSSLIVVFSLMGLILISSFLTSKVLSPSEARNNHRRRAMRNTNYQEQPIKESIQPKQESIAEEISVRREENRERPFMVEDRKPNYREEQIVENESFSKYQIDADLIASKKVRVVRSDSRRREPMRNYYTNDASRYAVINAYARESGRSTDLYAKFSKMSVEYSQSA